MTTTIAGLHPIFADCCAKEASRYAVDQPWVAGGWVYATDGRICVRQPCAEPNSVPPDGGQYPDVLTLDWDASLYPSDPVALPDIMDADNTGPCGNCDGSGLVLCNCPDCGEEHECMRCDGTKHEINRAYLRVGSAIVADHFVRILNRLNRHKCRVFVRDPRKGLRFVGDDGIEGIVMPCYEDLTPKNRILTPEQYNAECKVAEVAWKRVRP